MNPKQRPLELKSLRTAIDEAWRLHEHGYVAGGRWNLAETLEHCTDWLTFPIDGYPRLPFPIGLIFKGVSWLWGKRFFNQVIRENGFRPGTSTMPQTVKSMDSEEDLQALVRFEQAVERLLAFDGKPHPSPLFGRLSLEEHTTLQKIHVQHHLRFLHPRDSWE